MRLYVVVVFFLLFAFYHIIVKFVILIKYCKHAIVSYKCTLINIEVRYFCFSFTQVFEIVNTYFNLASWNERSVVVHICYYKNYVLLSGLVVTTASCKHEVLGSILAWALVRPSKRTTLKNVLGAIEAKEIYFYLLTLSLFKMNL